MRRTVERRLAAGSTGGEPTTAGMGREMRTRRQALWTFGPLAGVEPPPNPHGNRGERGCNIIPRASGQTSARSLHTRTFGAPIQEAKPMTGAGAAGAASHASVDWHRLPRQAVHRNVRRLQARIVQARKAGRWGTVQAWQHLLPHSCSGHALAVKRVTDNHGNRTPGVEGETWPTPTKKAVALCARQHRGARPHPWRRLYIPTSNGKHWPLGIENEARPRAAGALPARSRSPC